ncbi:hypothetical protein FRC08_008703 [Ceratobasidium sp. 394]|nr:hypothetical protein FRC08_008703 [Ceratobasidium sp. 394]
MTMVSVSVPSPHMFKSLARFSGATRARCASVYRSSGRLRPNRITPLKRKRPPLPRYDPNSDTDDEGESLQPAAKRLRSAINDLDQELLDLVGHLDEDVGRDVGEKGAEDGELESSDMEASTVSGVDDDDDECTVETARSADAYLDDYSVPQEGRADHYGFPWEDALGAVEIGQAFDVDEYIYNLPRLLRRRVRPNPIGRRPTCKKVLEPLRVALLASQLKQRIRSGSLTQFEILELASQRPLYSTRTDSRIQGEELSSEEDEEEGESENGDGDDFEEEDSSAPERPATPTPPGDSDSDSDSDDDDEPAMYSGKKISQHLSRREMERMGVYPDEE